MMKLALKNTIKILFFFTILFTACVAQNYGITSEVIPLDNGFGYVIRIDQKIVIKQTFIPAIEGNSPFCSEEEAKRTADFITKKMIEGKGPSVTIQELKELKIDFKCVHLL